MSPSGAGEAPLIAGKIHGVRGWTLAGGRLGAAVHDAEWAADGAPTRARCRMHRGHRAPHKRCGCGLYAVHPWAGGVQGEVVGVVEAWGRVQLHASGFRAQNARPIALFELPTNTVAEARALRQAARDYDCELIELEDWSEIEAVCARRGWGLGRGVVAELVPAEVEREQAAPRPATPTPMPAPPRPPRSRAEQVGDAFGIVVIGIVTLAYWAFWAVLGMGLIAGITGWHPLGWDADSEPGSTLARAPEVRMADEAIVPSDGRGTPVWVGVLRNRGDETAVWARPQLTYTSDAERVDVGRRDFAYPAVVPAGSRALVVQPLPGTDPKTLEVRPGPVSARQVDRAPRAPARVRAELVPAGGRKCRLVADVKARTPLERLRIWMLAGPSGNHPEILLQRSAGTIPAGRSRQQLDRFHDCPANLPQIRAFPAFGAGQLIE
jgi:hypothetical protein